jgi:hypothetical protein
LFAILVTGIKAEIIEVIKDKAIRIPKTITFGVMMLNVTSACFIKILLSTRHKAKVLAPDNKKLMEAIMKDSE